MTDIEYKAVKEMIVGQLGEVNTHMTAKIVSYDPTSMRASVIPTVHLQLADGSVLAPPVIHDVPVEWPVTCGGKAFIVMPMEEGDPVTLHFSQRSIDDWKGGSHGAPIDPRRFDLSDCTAHPCSDHRTVNTDGQCIELQYGAAQIMMYEDGRIVINGHMIHTGDTDRMGDVIHKGDTTHTGDTTQMGDTTQTGMVNLTGALTVSGIITTAIDLMAAGVSFIRHIHEKVQSGNSKTPPPSN